MTRLEAGRWDPAHFDAFLRRHAWVPGPGGEPVKLVPNRAQRRCLHEHPALRGVAGHYPCPKGRQAGWTTWWLLFCAFLCWFVPGVSILILTPNEDPTGLELIAKWRRLLQLLSTIGGAPLFSRLRNDSKNETTFDNGSRVTWHHIGGTESVADTVGRGGTYDFVLASEYGFPHEADLARRAMEALRPALERAGAPVVYDSTPGEAGGTGEPYLDVIRAVRDGLLRGLVFFVGWWEIEAPHHRAMVRGDLTAFGRSLSVEERGLIGKHGVTLDQLQWRRDQIALMGRPGFLKAYPERLEHLFDKRRRRSELFDADHLEEIREARDAGEWPEPLPLWELAALGLDARPFESLVPSEGIVRFFAVRDGEPAGSVKRRMLGEGPAGRPEVGSGSRELERWLQRRQERERARGPRGVAEAAKEAAKERVRWRYHAGIDSSDGYPDSDWQSCVVLDREGALAALVLVRVNPIRYAAICQALLEYYGATARIEAQHGALIAELIQGATPPERLALAGDVSSASLEVLEGAWGGPVEVVQTSRQSRPLIVDAAMTLLTSGAAGVVVDSAMLEQMEDLHRSSEGRIEARPGEHDDLFIALGLAGLERERWLQWAPREARRPALGAMGRRGGRYGYLR